MIDPRIHSEAVADAERYSKQCHFLIQENERLKAELERIKEVFQKESDDLWEAYYEKECTTITSEAIRKLALSTAARIHHLLNG